MAEKNGVSEEDRVTNTFESNFDILYNELSLTRNRIIQNFTITTDSYVLLSNNLYQVLCAENSSFAEKVSDSAFQYYAIMLLWQRLGQFLPPGIRKSSPFFKKLSHIGPHLTHIPKCLELYLRGIGNFVHPYFGEMRFRLPEALVSEKFSITTGTFGKVDADTHYLYEAFPAPGVAALRILADISKTRNSLLSDPIWDLPEDLRPDVNEQGLKESGEPRRILPTRNLLGWSLAQTLTAEQLELFRESGLESDISHNDMTQFFENSTKLLTTISSYFNIKKKLVNSTTQQSAAGQVPKQTTTKPEPQVNDPFLWSNGLAKVQRWPFTGSIIQGLSVTKVSDSSEFDRTKMYCEGAVSVSSFSENNKSIVMGAVVTGFRMSKEPIIHNKHSWCCYDFNKYECVPQSWITTRNSIYSFEKIEGLNQSRWTTGITDKSLTQYSFLQKYFMLDQNTWNIYM